MIHLLKTEQFGSTLVFSRTKHGADKIVKVLGKAGIRANAIHGNKSQNARVRALGDFKSGRTKILIATDIAARGIDVEELSLVVNYDLPNIPETYVHRIGRTGRANFSGIAISFCNEEEKAYLKDIQKLINQQIPVVEEHPFTDIPDDVPPQSKAKPQRPPRTSASEGSGHSQGAKKHWNRNRPYSKKRY